MYTRSGRFADCLRLLLNAGADLHDPLLTALLLDDEELLRLERGAQASAPGRRFDLEYLCRKRYGTSPAMPNVPNRYLTRG